MDQMEMNVQLCFPAALFPGKDSLYQGRIRWSSDLYILLVGVTNCKLSHSRFLPCPLQLIILVIQTLKYILLSRHQNAAQNHDIKR
jgi:hypothetical protein